MSKLALAADENGDGAECEHFQRGAAKENPAHRAAPVRPNDDQITSLILCRLDDPLGGMLILDVQGPASDGGRFGRFSRAVQDRGGASGRSLFISLDERRGG